MDIHIFRKRLISQQVFSSAKINRFSLCRNHDENLLPGITSVETTIVLHPLQGLILCCFTYTDQPLFITYEGADFYYGQKTRTARAAADFLS